MLLTGWKPSVAVGEARGQGTMGASICWGIVSRTCGWNPAHSQPLQVDPGRKLNFANKPNELGNTFPPGKHVDENLSQLNIE